MINNFSVTLITSSYLVRGVDNITDMWRDHYGVLMNRVSNTANNDWNDNVSIQLKCYETWQIDWQINSQLNTLSVPILRYLCTALVHALVINTLALWQQSVFVLLWIKWPMSWLWLHVRFWKQPHWISSHIPTLVLTSLSVSMELIYSQMLFSIINITAVLCLPIFLTHPKLWTIKLWSLVDCGITYYLYCCAVGIRQQKSI